MKSLFSELNGFVVFEPKLLKEYLEVNQLVDRDLLRYFTETDHGDIITQEGIAIPIMGVETGYYHFQIICNDNPLLLQEEETKQRSSGWVFQADSGQLCVVGIGYLTNVESIHANCLTYQVDKGWYSVDILCGEKDGQEEYMIELLFRREDRPPQFLGDFEKEYS